MRAHVVAGVVVASAGCAGGVRPGPRPDPHGAGPAPVMRPRPAPVLAVETEPPGRLVLERDGTAWAVHCDHGALTRRPWQGGDAAPAGACEDDQLAIAIAGDTVAAYLRQRGAIAITRGGVEVRAIAVAEAFWIRAIALDGEAVVVIAQRYLDPKPGDGVAGTAIPTSLAAVVRVEGAGAEVHELVAYGSTGHGMNPAYVATGPDRMVLADTAGSVATCDYRGACTPPTAHLELNRSEGGRALPDGSLVVFQWEQTVTRIDPNGALAWTTPLRARALLGSTATAVWVQTFPPGYHDRGWPVIALELRGGAAAGVPAVVREAEHDEDGRYLAIAGVAPTAAGDVVRGVFGGTLAAGALQLATERLRATCYWETPHSASEHDVDFDAECEGRFAKAIYTTRAPFVAINAELLQQ